MWVDLFASGENAQEAFFCSKATSAYAQNWEDLSTGQGDDEPWLWANPPFGDFARIMGKLQRESVRPVLLVPYWPKQWWFAPLRQMAERSVLMRKDRVLYPADGRRRPHASGHMGQHAPAY